MIELNKKELNQINGGAISGAIVSSIIRGVNLIFDIGKGLGSAVRRLVTGKYC